MRRVSLANVNTDEDEHMRNPYTPGFERVTIPEGKSGKWSVVRYTVTRADLGIYNLRLIRDRQAQRILPPGTYTRLQRGGACVMSDTPAESHEHARLLRAAKGRILLNGLGLGFCLAAILRKPGVDAVTVIEKSADVLALVQPHITDPRVTIVHADALEWRPAKGVRFDVVWHDIWTDVLNSDDKPEVTKLRRAYGPRCDWQSCWSEEYAGLTR
jgi:hypothetical protein